MGRQEDIKVFISTRNSTCDECGDFRSALEAMVHMGGDTDSTAAIVGALAGGTLGAGAIPVEWVSGIIDWPRSTRWILKLSTRLARHFAQPALAPRTRPLPLFWPAILP